MTRLAGLFSLMISFSYLWQECCDNLLVFCYRIGWSLVFPLRAGVAEPDRPKPCSNHSESSFAFSTTSKD